MVELGHEQRPTTAAPVMLDNIRSLIGKCVSIVRVRVRDVVGVSMELCFVITCKIPNAF